MLPLRQTVSAGISCTFNDSACGILTVHFDICWPDQGQEHAAHSISHSLPGMMPSIQDQGLKRAT